jgi:hypothetical protein
MKKFGAMQPQYAQQQHHHSQFHNQAQFQNQPQFHNPHLKNGVNHIANNHKPEPPQRQVVQMNSSVHTKFEIYKFRLDYELNIYYKEETTNRLLYLSCDENGFEIYFADSDNGSGRQRWVIEPSEEEGIVYIKTVFYHSTRVKYIGSPNRSNRVNLYTSKNKYTRWSIAKTDNSTYEIKYAGEKFDPAKVALVIARCAENIRWVVAYEDIAIVYNKGDKCDITVTHPIIPLPNVGREGHTYLHHIIDKYDILSEQIIFTQADPFVHNPTILYGIDNHFLLDEVQPMGMYYLRSVNLPPLQFSEENKIVTDYGLEYLTIYSNGDLICPDFFDQGMVDLRKNADADYKGIRFETKPVTEGFLNRAIFPITKPLHQIKFVFCGLFAVNRNRIMSYHKVVYQGLLEELISKNPQGGVNGYILEKMWLYIFEK